MKKIVLAIISLSLLLVIFLTSCTEEDLLLTSTSPNKTYTVEAYLSNSGATVDYSIKVYLLDNSKKTLIYNKYHDYDAKIEWIDDEIISINEITLDLSKGETYDWRSGITIKRNLPNKKL